MRVRYSLVLAFVGAIVATQAVVSAAPVGTAFTYQGRVEDASGAITDTCDLEFSLWDADSAGLQVGGSVGMSTLVEDGLFTVTLDFGTGAMNGEARWLELAVCCPSSCTVETLDPRQELTPTPQAIRAMEGVGPPEAINVDASGNVGIGTTTPARALHIQKGIGSIRVDGDGNSPGMLFVRTAPGDFDTVWKSFGIGVKGTSPGSGELVISDKGTAVSGAGQRRLTIDTDGNVGIGTETPTELLTVAGTVESTAGGFKLPDGTIVDDASDLGGASPWISSGDDILYTSGSVGIGISGPFLQAGDSLITKIATLPSGRNRLACAADSTSGKIYCFGGLGDSGYLNEIVEYDPVTDTVTTMTATLPTGRTGLACAADSASGKIYCFGGQDLTGYLDEIVEYNPVADTLTTMTATLPSARRELACAADSASGNIYCFGGSGGSGHLNEIVEYDPVTDTVNTMTATLPSARHGLACAADGVSGKIFCFGGFSSSSAPLYYLDEIVQYDPATDSLVTMIATLPSIALNLACAADGSSGQIHCFGGNGSSGRLDEIIRYEPVGDSLATITATLPSARYGLACAAEPASGKIYCFGGYDDSSLDEVVEYDLGPQALLQVGDPGDGTGAIANTWSVFSSRTFKRDIAALQPSDYELLLAKLNATDVVRYSYIHDTQRTVHLGVIAEDSPREILTPGGKAVSLGDYTTFLMAAIKAQQNQLATQQAEIAALNSRLGALESAGSPAPAAAEEGAP